MIDVNTTIPPMLEPLSNFAQIAIQYMQIFVGGIFGLYVILILIRIYQGVVYGRILYDIRDELRAFNTHFKIKVKQRDPFLKRLKAFEKKEWNNLKKRL